MRHTIRIAGAIALLCCSAARPSAQQPQQPTTMPPQFGGEVPTIPQFPQYPQQPGIQPAGGNYGPNVLPQQQQGNNTIGINFGMGPWVQGFEANWSRPVQQPFAGFPSFPSRLSGYGNYPLPVAPGQSILPGLLLPPAPPEEPGWPAWTRLRDRPPLPFAPDLALLIRDGDRVWWRIGPEDPFEPLYFYDKLRTLGPRAEVEVRESGDFQLLLHDSTRLRASGPTALRLVKLTETAVQIDFSWLSKLVFTVRQRDHVIRLPDGSRLRITSPSSSDDMAMTAIVELNRADEPGWLGGRATLTNLGGRAIEWEHPFGRTTLGPSKRVTLFLEAPVHQIGTPLQGDGVEFEPRGNAVVARTSGGGRVDWCGARFDLPAGSQLLLDPLQGAPFQPPTPPGPLR